MEQAWKDNIHEAANIISGQYLHPLIAQQLRRTVTEIERLEQENAALQAQVNAAQRQQQYIAGIIESEGKYIP